MDGKQWVIYCLSHPSTCAHVRYIGITSQSLETRLKYHLNRNGYNRELCSWVQTIREEGIHPSIAEIARVHGTRAQAEQEERLWIWRYLARGYDLLNTAYIPGDKTMFAEFLHARYAESFTSLLRTRYSARTRPFNHSAPRSISP